MTTNTLLDIFFNDLFYNDGFTPVGSIQYPMDIYEENDTLHIDIAAIGKKESDIEIQSKGTDTLHVSAKSSTEKQHENRVWHTRHISSKDFDFALKIPARFDLQSVEADFNNGLVSITIPLKIEQKPKTIKFKNN